LATIYRTPAGYRLYWRQRVDGKPKSLMKDFRFYAEAKREGDRVVTDLAKGKLAATLTPGQVTDALAALERLRGFYAATGRKFSLLGAVSEFVEAAAKLHGKTLGDAVESYLQTVATVKRKDLAEAVEEFIAADEPKTKAPDGQRAQLSNAYFRNRAIQIRRFAGAFPGHAVCDLGKSHLDTFIGALGKMKSKSRNRRGIASAKTRNGYRATVKQFLQWAVRKDYLIATHRLGEADGLRPEQDNGGEVVFYSARELAALLENADETLRPLVAIGGLAGLRTAELLRLDWADVWRVPGHIEVTAKKAKTRARRLVEICRALQAWLEPYRVRERGKLWSGHEVTFQQHFVNLCEQADVTRKVNGLRHGFATHYFALHQNENATAAQMGDSPQMVFAHYRGLATKREGEQWFNILPPKSAKNIVQLRANQA
jgi:integrase